MTEEASIRETENPTSTMSRRGPQTLVPGTVITCPWREGSEGGHSKLELLDVLQKDGIFSKVYRCRDKATSREVS